jgi:hypothetical protein
MNDEHESPMFWDVTDWAPAFARRCCELRSDIDGAQALHIAVVLWLDEGGSWRSRHPVEAAEKWASNGG